jgi:CubicO group peptidase (beta-lactamase class C family)
MKRYFRLLLLSCFITGSFLNGSLYAQTPDFISKDLDNYILEGMKKWNIPGVSVAIVKDGRIVLTKGYGVLEYGKKEKVDENTLFMIASNTKAFVGTSLAWLDYQEKCSLDDYLVDWVPGFRMNDPWVGAHVKLSDILSHQIGLSTFQGDFLYFYSNLTKEDIYKKFPKIVPDYGFREKYGYSNVGFFWAGESIKRITGEEWNVFVENNILVPLEMNRTKILSVNIADEKNLASVHTMQDGELKVFPHTNIDVIGPAASMRTSAKDMSHWLLAQLDSGRYKEKQVIPFEVIENTRNPRIEKGRSKHPFNNTHYSLYGLGWALEDYENREIISHTGGLIGFVTSVSLVPEEKLGIVVLTNSDANWFYDALKWEIIDAYLSLPRRNYCNLYHHFYIREQSMKNENLKAINDTILMHFDPDPGLNAFTGKYYNEIYGEINIEIQNEELILSFEHHPELKARLQFINEDRFLCTYYPERMGIEVFPFRIENKMVTGFSLKVADRLEYNRYEFVKTD